MGAVPARPGASVRTAPRGAMGVEACCTTILDCTPSARDIHDAPAQARRSRRSRRRRTAMTTLPAAAPPANAADARRIEEFLDTSWMERGLAAATLSAYRGDLSLFSRWLSSRGLGLAEARRLDVLDFLSEHAHWPPRTVARRLSALRTFYQHLEREGRIRSNPCDRIDAPRLGRPLPGVLTEQEVERLLADRKSVV